MGIVERGCHVLADLSHKKKDELQTCKFYKFGVTASRAWMKLPVVARFPQLPRCCLARVVMKVVHCPSYQELININQLHQT